MPTSVEVAFQNFNATAYAKHKVFLTVDPAFDIGGNSPFVLEGKVRKVSIGLNEQISSARIEYIRPFGSHPGFVIPIAIFVDSADNMVFRGFITDEEGILDATNDQVVVDALDYKWLISKITKIRGKIYTVDNDVLPDVTPSASSRIFTDPSLYERFRYMIPGISDTTLSLKDGTGFLGTERTVFNEGGDPDCASPTPDGAACFKLDPDQYYNNIQRTYRRQRRNEKYFWTYASMLQYIWRHWIGNVFNGDVVAGLKTTRINISSSSLYNIYRFGQQYGMEQITPIGFDINNKNPVEAIDKIVKSIPGSWYWRLIYFPSTVLIDIQCSSEPAFKLPAKSLFIGGGGKLNDASNNNVNVASINVKTSVRSAISHAIVVGSPIEIETTVQYVPAWEQYLRPVSDLSATSLGDFGAEVTAAWDGSTIDAGYYVSDFKGIADYTRWKQFLHGDLKSNSATSKKMREEITVQDEQRYSRIYRKYVFPENTQQITRFAASTPLHDFIPDYQSFVTNLTQLFFKYVLRIRKVKDPITEYRNNWAYAPFSTGYSFDNLKGESKKKHHRNPPFVFEHDNLLKTAKHPEKGNVSAATAARMLEVKKWIIPEEEHGNNYALEQDNKTITFELPQYQRQVTSVAKIEDQSYPSFKECVSRQVFATVRIECDVPYVKDVIDKQTLYSNARLIGEDLVKEKLDVTAVIRTGAIFPNPLYLTGNNLDYVPPETEDEQTGSVENNGPTTAEDAVIGSKLIDGNYLNDNPRKDAQLIKDDGDLIKQLLNILMYKKPAYDIAISADLGRLDISYLIGDRIDRIVGSELADGSGGYYNMDCYIDKLDMEAEGVTDSWTTKLNAKNTLPITSKVRKEPR